jgi:glyoxylate reductase
MAASQPAVLVTRRLVPGVVDRLSAVCDVTVHDHDLPMPRAELLTAVQGMTAVLTTLDERVDAELLSAAGQALRIVANHAVSTHNIDLASCAARGVVTPNAPGVVSKATAEMV